jgi:hypothetical protein
MANGRRSRVVSPRSVAVGVVVTLAAGLLSPAPPVGAAPPETSGSAIGTGMVSDFVDYRVAAYLPAAENDAAGDVEIEDIDIAGSGACQPLQGTVSQADIDESLQGEPPPTGEGAWQYEVCAADEATANRVAAAYPQVGAARQYCGPPYQGEDICGVFIRWVPAVPGPVPPASPDGQQAYLESLFDFAPVLETSPGRDPQHGLIAFLPAWFWNTVETRFPKAVPGGQAWHLRTTFDTDNRQACRVSGLHKVGTVYNSADPQPERPSPTNCGHTYTNQGLYEVRGCTRWLFIISALLFPVVFTATFCDSDTLTVKEVQVVSGGGPRRRPLG